MEIRTDSSADAAGGSTTPQQPQLPPGFRFHPTDEELVVHYLKRKAQSAPLPVSIIADVDLYKFDPWELPAKAVFGEQEWYFFSPRDRKYPNGARPNRAATSGYWKATGTDKPVLTAGGSQKVGVKKALVFYGGKPPRGAKTNWIMHEYRLADNKSINKPPGCDPTHKKGSLRLDDWVLCRIYKKNNNTNRGMDHQHHDHHQHHHHHHEDGDQDSMHDILGSLPCTLSIGQQQQLHPQNYGAALLDSSYHPHHPIFHAGIMDGSDHPTSNTLKRAHPSLYWSDDVTAAPVTVGPPSGKRSTVDDGEDSGSAALLSHLPAQTPPLIGVDGAFRQPYHVPGINWYS